MKCPGVAEAPVLAGSSVCQPSKCGEWRAGPLFNDIIITSHPVTLPTAMYHHLSPSPFPRCPACPLSCTQVARTRGRRWSSHHLSNPPPRQYTFPSCEASFLGSNYWPRPPFSFRALHTSGGAAAERSGLIVCPGELAPSAGAKRYHHQLQDLIQRQPQPARALVGKPLSGRWVTCWLAWPANLQWKQLITKPLTPVFF